MHSSSLFTLAILAIALGIVLFSDSTEGRSRHRHQRHSSHRNELEDESGYLANSGEKVRRSDEVLDSKDKLPEGRGFNLLRTLGFGEKINLTSILSDKISKVGEKLGEFKETIQQKYKDEGWGEKIGRFKDTIIDTVTDKLGKLRGGGASGTSETADATTAAPAKRDAGSTPPPDSEAGSTPPPDSEAGSTPPSK